MSDTTKHTVVRPIYEIADDIRRCWPNPNYAVIPYLNAMDCLMDVSDMFGLDTGRAIISYFLNHADSWRSADGQRIRAELKSMITSEAQ